MYRLETPVVLVTFVEQEHRIIIDPQQEVNINRKIIKELLDLEPDRFRI